RISSFLVCRSLLLERTRLICASVNTGKAWVRASSALGIGREDIFPSQANQVPHAFAEEQFYRTSMSMFVRPKEVRIIGPYSPFRPQQLVTSAINRTGPSSSSGDPKRCHSEISQGTGREDSPRTSEPISMSSPCQ